MLDKNKDDVSDDEYFFVSNEAIDEYKNTFVLPKDKNILGLIYNTYMVIDMKNIIIPILSDLTTKKEFSSLKYFDKISLVINDYILGPFKNNFEFHELVKIIETNDVKTLKSLLIDEASGIEYSYTLPIPDNTTAIFLYDMIDVPHDYLIVLDDVKTILMKLAKICNFEERTMFTTQINEYFVGSDININFIVSVIQNTIFPTMKNVVRDQEIQIIIERTINSFLGELCGGIEHYIKIVNSLNSQKEAQKALDSKKETQETSEVNTSKKSKKFDFKKSLNVIAKKGTDYIGKHSKIEFFYNIKSNKPYVNSSLNVKSKRKNKTVLDTKRSNIKSNSTIRESDIDDLKDKISDLEDMVDDYEEKFNELSNEVEYNKNYIKKQSVIINTLALKLDKLLKKLDIYEE